MALPARHAVADSCVVSTILYPNRARSTQHPAAELVLSRAAAGARKAPAVGEKRPWRWEITGDHAELHVPADALHAAEHLVNGGSALHHAYTVLAGAGARTVVQLLPDPAWPHRLATMDVTSFGAATAAEIRAHRAVSLRSTTGAAAAAPAAVPASTRRILAAAVADHGATLALMPSPAGEQHTHSGLVVAGGEDPATLLRLGQALSAVALAAAMERLTIAVAPALSADASGRPAVRIDIQPLAGRPPQTSR
jgi:hypothetical protein